MKSFKLNKHNIVNSILAIIFVFSLSPVLANAGVDKIEAIANPTEIEVGESFVYQVILTGSGRLPTPNVNIPSQFQIVTGPNSNLSMEFINGQMASNKTISYMLRAMRQGTFIIPAPEVKVRREVMKGNDIKILVKTPGKAPQANSSSQSGRETLQVKKGEELPEIFLRAEVNSNDVYFQQPVTVTYWLYFIPSVSTYDLQKLPSTVGFWTEKWDAKQQPDIVERNVGGQRYNAALIHRSILFPTKIGMLEIGPMEIVAKYRKSNQRRSRSVFNDFFSDNQQTKLAASEPVYIRVKPLPEDNKPSKFDNIVGDYRINAILDNKNVTTNESVTLTVTVSGTGNLGFLPEPVVQIPTDIESYEPEITQEKRSINGNVQGSKTFKYLLIPRRAGNQNIPPITLSYFDPEKKRYIEKKSNPLSIRVSQSSGWADVENLPGGAAAKVHTLGTDIRWIHESTKGLERIGPPIQETTSYWIAYVFPMMFLISGWQLRKRQLKIAGQQGLIRSKKASKSAMKALKEARSLHASKEVETGYDALAKGVLFYISDRIVVPVGELDEKRINTELNIRNISEASIQELLDIVHECNSARFTPEGSSADALLQMIERSERWISTVDGSLGS
jgi:BatD DUF11 like domain